MIADLCLILLLDGSGSVSAEEWKLQARATADAISSPAIVEKITHGPNGRIAVMAFEWSENQRLIMSWTEIASLEDAAHVARLLTLYRRELSGSTGAGDALTASLRAFGEAPACDKRTVDISGDGASNWGADPYPVVTLLSAAGIIVNALVIEDEPNVLDYYAGLVSGFAMAATWDSYAQAIKAKLTLEIAGLAE